MFESRLRTSVLLTLLIAFLLVPGLTRGQESPPPVAEPEATEAPAPESPEAPAVPDWESESRDRARRHSVTKDTQVHMMSDLEVGRDDVARDAIAILGDVDIRGKVRGDAVAVMGSVTVTGQVMGSVTAIGDDVVLGPDAEVLGDVTSVGGRVDRDPSARVMGEISEIDLGPALRASEVPFHWNLGRPDFWDMWHFGLAWDLFWTITKWILLLLITSFILLVARQPVERVRRVVEGEFWKAGLIGLATWLLLFPVLLVATIILAISIIGIPLLLIMWPLAIFVLLVACFVGFTATAWALGGWLGRRFGWESTNPYAAMLIGVIAIQLLSLVAHLLGGIGGPVWFFALMFGLTGWFVRFVAWTVGLGGALLAFAERGRTRSSVPLEPPPPPPTTGRDGGTDGAAGAETLPTSSESADSAPDPSGSG